MKTASTIALALTAGACVAAAQAGPTYVTDFEGGADGWEGPQGPGGSSFIDPTHGVGGSAGLRTQFLDFGIAFTNSTNSAFLGDYTSADEVTISVDVKVDLIGQFLPVSRPFMLELRDYDYVGADTPWISVWYEFAWISSATNSEYTTFTATISDPSSTTLPTGWRGYGDFDPNTFESILPSDVTFADVLADVDEIAFSTLEPDFFFTDDLYDVTIDNVTISRVPTPSALAVIGLGAGGLCVRRRRGA